MRLVAEGVFERGTREAYLWSLLGGSLGASSLLFMSVKYDLSKINFIFITITTVIVKKSVNKTCVRLRSVTCDWKTMIPRLNWITL